ncbi:MAG: c-type cytochrome [Saprospiraceae bacterium]
MNKFIFSLFLSLLLFSACKNTSESIDLTSEFTLEKGFHIAAVAAEPLLTSPVAIEFDEKGRIWAVEMTGYMRDIDGSDEKEPDGKISILEDTDGDGVMDNKKVFLDELVLPRAIELINGGLLYTEPPNLWWVPIENDQPGEAQLVDSMYSNGGNVEHAPNGLIYNLDNWIYSAKCDRRYRLRDGKWETEATYFKGQWGITNDDAGHLYYNNNSNPIYGDFVQSNQTNANPFLESKNLEKQNLSKSRRFYPSHPTLINRGYNDGSFDEAGRVKHFTSACSPLIYRGAQFRNDYYGQAFVCGPEGNLVKRFKLETTKGKMEAKATSEGSEFLVSNDETFRPVNLNNGPDGALYVVDMRRAIIQHRAFMTSYLKELIIKNKMDSLPITGRIFRVADSTNTVKALPDLSQLSLAEWVPLLQSTNGWQRKMAQKKLIYGKDKRVVADITAIAKDYKNPLGQIQALWTLEGMGELSADLLTSLSSGNTPLFSQMILLAKTILTPDNEMVLMQIFSKAGGTSEFDPNLQLAHSLQKMSEPSSKKPHKENMWIKLADEYADNPLIAEALVSSIAGKEKQYLSKVKKDSYLEGILMKTLINIAEDNRKELVLSVSDQTDGRTRGFELYQTYCGTCHGMDGKGMEGLAPPLYQSEYVDGPPEHIALVMLNGLRGPITVHGKTYEGAAVMPGIKQNPDISDKDINDIIAFIKSGFTSKPKWSKMTESTIAKLRAATADRKEMFTEEELKAWPLDGK